MALAAASSLTAQTPGQGKLTAECKQAIERVSKRPQARGMDGKRANLTLRGVSPRGTGSTARILVDGGAVYSIITVPVELNGMMAQGSFIPVHATKAPSESRDPSDLDRLEDVALRCVRGETGIQTTFRF